MNQGPLHAERKEGTPFRGKLLQISYKDVIVDDDTHRTIQAATGEYDELLTLVKKLNFHISRSFGLAKTIVQDTVKGKRRSGRQKKRWGKSIKEWTDMDFSYLFLSIQLR